MSDSATPTKWIVAGLVLGGVVVISLIVLVASLRGDGGTSTVESTTPTSTSAPDVTSTPDRSSTTVRSDVVEEQIQLRVGDASRTALVIAPAGVAPGEQLPVVVALHGLGVDAPAMSRAGDWRGAVARDRFVAVFPQGVDNSWNMGPCCPPSNLRGVADSAFLDRLVDELSARDDVDVDRMFLSGFSNGALMVYSYACEHPDVFAAVAPMAGSNVTGCTPPSPVSLLHQHGDADLVVPFGGGVALGSLVSSAPFPAVPASVAAWARADGCGEEPTVSDDADVQRTQWSGCAEGTKVELVRVPGKGHVWLTKGDYDPLDEMLRFFGLR